jgi:hypothetical protein
MNGRKDERTNERTGKKAGGKGGERTKGRTERDERLNAEGLKDGRRSNAGSTGGGEGYRK